MNYAVFLGNSTTPLPKKVKIEVEYGSSSYLRRAWPWWWVAIAWTVMGLCGNPVWFVIAGCLVSEMLCCAFRKDWKAAGRCAAIGGVWGIGMALYFLAWLNPVASSDYMQGYWQDNMLPWPVSMTAVRDFVGILEREFFAAEFGKRKFLMILLCAGSLVLALKTRHRWGLIVWLALGAAGAASCLHLFPVSMRLWLFAVPLTAILAFWTVERITVPRWPRMAGVILAALAVSNLGILRYWNPQNNPIMEGEKAKASIAYVREHLKDGDRVYVYGLSIPAVKYLIGYDSERLGATSSDNLIWGGSVGTDPEALEHDVAAITSSGRCWLVMTHVFASATGDFLKRLSASGDLTLVHEFHNTPVYQWRQSLADE